MKKPAGKKKRASPPTRVVREPVASVADGAPPPFDFSNAITNPFVGRYDYRQMTVTKKDGVVTATPTPIGPPERAVFLKEVFASRDRERARKT